MKPVVVTALASPAIIGGIASWRRMARWGATTQETRAEMPGDELVGRARYRNTHAIAIAASPEDVWPWLLQLGQGRGGLYSYDWLENIIGLDIHSADRLEARFQDLAVGDVVRMVPEGTEPPLRFVVAQLESPRLLVLGPDRTREAAFATHLPYPAWTLQLTREGAGHCRLLVRFQADFAPTPLGWLAYRCALQPVHFMMERAMMRGIKERAERAAAESSPVALKTA